MSQLDHFQFNLSQKYSRLRCLLWVKVLVFGFYFSWSGSILQFRQTIIKVRSVAIGEADQLTLSQPGGGANYAHHITKSHPEFSDLVTALKVGSKSWLLTCNSNITLSLPSCTGSALKRELNFCNDYLSLLYFWPVQYPVLQDNLLRCQHLHPKVLKIDL